MALEVIAQLRREQERHGKWMYDRGRRSTCSVCGWAVTVDMGFGEKLKIPITPEPFWAYCPNCGARMDGGGNE